MEGYVADEAKVIPVLTSAGSVSGGIFRRFSITRDVVAAVLDQLRRSRAPQATFCRIVCATRLKFFEWGALVPTICQFCEQIDSLDHLISCVNIGKPLKDTDQLVLYLAELASRAYNVNPNMPVPHRAGSDADIELFPSEGDGESEGEDLDLDFEDDAIQQLDESALLGLQGETVDEKEGSGGAQTREGS